MIELWRAHSTKDAYTDQTGKGQWGYVVYERCVVVDTGERFAIETGYDIRGEETAGRIYIRPTRVTPDGLLVGDEFRYYPNLVDYSGRGTWRNATDPDDQSKERGWWQAVPYSTEGYVHPDGTPVEPALRELSELVPLSDDDRSQQDHRRDEQPQRTVDPRNAPGA